MTRHAASQSMTPVLERGVRIVHRTRGQRHGPVTRLMSPGDLGQALKPFVFLDLIDADTASLSGFGLHPHSGIATLTHLFEGDVRYEDTTGATGYLPEGGVEWFRAAQGAWHGGGGGRSRRARGFQLWLALPPDQELGPVESLYQAPEDIARDGPARVLLGGHGEAVSALRPPAPTNYLAVRLKAGETWRYSRPADHSVAWVALSRGAVTASDRIESGELAVFESGGDAIDFRAESDAEFVLGSSAPHRHDLVMGYYSVHTSPATLAAGERRIAEIGRQLKAQGRL